MKLKTKLIIENLKKQIEVLEYKLAKFQNPTETKPKADWEYAYPLYFESTYDGTIVKFTDINTGVTVKLGTHSLVDIGISTDSWTPHTDAVWKTVAHNKERDLFDKQLVWGWDNDDTHRRILRFYNAMDDYVLSYRGKRIMYKVDNYEAYKGEYPEWAKEAYKTLED